jgi:hypothetical protein
MPRVDEPVHLLALPADRQLDRSAERIRQPFDHSNGHATQAAALDPRHRRSTRPAHRREIYLAQASATTEMPQGWRDVRPQHAASMGDTAYCALILRPLTYDELRASPAD